MVYYEVLSVRTEQRSHWVDISSGVQKIVTQSSIKNGIVTVSSLHTTAGLTINENADPDVERDFFWKLKKLIPRDPQFHHSEGNSDSHLKSSYVGFSAQVPVQNGMLVLGTWQSLYFCEFDGPRNRRVSITMLGE